MGALVTLIFWTKPPKIKILLHFIPSPHYPQKKCHVPVGQKLREENVFGQGLYPDVWVIWDPYSNIT